MAQANNSKYNNKRKEMQSDKVSMPPMRYKLTKLTQAQTLSKIASLTSGFYDMSVSGADWVQRDVRSREFSSFGSIKAPQSADAVKQIVGQDNYYLKLTTKTHDIDFITHDKEKNEFHFWGEYQNCIKAMNELRYRVCKIESRMVKPAEVAAPPEKKRRPSPLCLDGLADALPDVSDTYANKGGVTSLCLSEIFNALPDVLIPSVRTFNREASYDPQSPVQPYSCTSPAYHPTSPTYNPTSPYSPHSPTYPPPMDM
jgi:hypothetical protein